MFTYGNSDMDRLSGPYWFPLSPYWFPLFSPISQNDC